MVLMRDVPARVPFVLVAFEPEANEVLIHHGLVHNGFDYDGESKHIYDVQHIGTLVDGRIVKFAPEDIKDREVSSRAGNLYDCEIVEEQGCAV